MLDGRTQMGMDQLGLLEQTGNAAAAAEADLHPAVLECGAVMAEAARVILAVLAEVDLAVQSVVTAVITEEAAGAVYQVILIMGLVAQATLVDCLAQRVVRLKVAGQVRAVCLLSFVQELLW